MSERGFVHQAWASFAEGRGDMFNNPVLKEIGDAYGKSVAKVILRWLIQRNVVMITKYVHKERMAENFNVFDFSLSESDMPKIAVLDIGKGLFMNHRDPAIARRLGNLKFDIEDRISHFQDMDAVTSASVLMPRNVGLLAQWIEEETGVDKFSIITEEPYSNDYGTCLNRVIE